MTRLNEILENSLKITELEEVVKVGEEAYDKVIKDRKKDYLDLFKTYFQEVLKEGDELKVGYEGVNIMRVLEEKRRTEIFSMSMRSSSWRDEDVDKIDTSFYSTSDSSIFELERMITLGKVGLIIRDHYDDIIAGYNQIKNKYKDTLTALNEEGKGYRDSIANLRQQTVDIQYEEIENLMESEKGISFEMPEIEDYTGRTVQLEVKYNHTLNRIKAIKVLSRTASGKSAAVEVTMLNKVWDQNSKEYKFEEYTQTYKNVRVANIDSMLKRYSDRVLHLELN